MKTILKGSTSKEGFYLKKEKPSFSDKHSFWIGHKDNRGDTHEQRISEAAYIILKAEMHIP